MSVTLLDALLGTNRDVLDQMYSALGSLAGEPRRMRKPELAAEINRIVMHKTKSVWDLLENDEKALLQDTIHHSEGRYSIDRQRSRHGSLPGSLVVESRARHRHFSKLYIFLYCLEWGHFTRDRIPDDLLQKLRSFVPEPLAETVRTLAPGALPEMVAPEPHRYRSPDQLTPVPLQVREQELAACTEVHAVLRLAAQGKLGASAKTFRPSATSLRRVDDILFENDFYPSGPVSEDSTQSRGPIRAFAWHLLLQAGKLVKINGSRFELTRAGRKALSDPPQDALRLMWNNWLGTDLIDEFSRINDVKGQTARARGRSGKVLSPVVERRRAICDALAHCPVGNWLRADELARFMRATDAAYSVARNAWKLYVADAHYGTLEHLQDSGWNLLDRRYLWCFLLEYAATLGMVDVAISDPCGIRSDFHGLWGAEFLEFLSRYDGLHFIRLTPLGAYCLGLADSYEPPARDVEVRLSVFADRRIVVQEGTPGPAEQTFLSLHADEEEAGRAWRLSSDRILQAIESGSSVAEIRAFLQARDEQSLPERVDGYLATIERDSVALAPKGPAIVFECASADIARRLAGDRKVARYCLVASGRSLVVKAESETSFRTAVRQMGLGFRS